MLAPLVMTPGAGGTLQTEPGTLRWSLGHLELLALVQRGGVLGWGGGGGRAQGAQQFQGFGARGRRLHGLGRPG